MCRTCPPGFAASLLPAANAPVLNMWFRLVSPRAFVIAVSRGSNETGLNWRRNLPLFVCCISRFEPTRRLSTGSGGGDSDGSVDDGAGSQNELSLGGEVIRCLAGNDCPCGTKFEKVQKSTREPHRKERKHSDIHENSLPSVDKRRS